FPYSQTLLVFQAIFLFGGIIFMFLIAEKLLNNDAAAFVIALSFAISPFLVRAIDFDFHFSPFHVFFMLGFIYFAEADRLLKAGVFFLLAIIVKEEVSIYLFFVSVFFCIRKKHAAYAYMAAVSAVYALLVIAYVMPAFS